MFTSSCIVNHIRLKGKKKIYLLFLNYIIIVMRDDNGEKGKQMRNW